ncbi:unnamed protein product, partial [Staurois parvus]
CLTYFLSCETSKYDVPGPFEYWGKRFACIFHDDKRLWTASGNGRVKRNFQTQTLINTVSHVYTYLQAFGV